MNSSNQQTLKSAALFERMEALLKNHGADIAKKVQCVFLFEIKPAKNQAPVYFTLDLKNGEGRIMRGKVGQVDVTFSILDEDMILMAAGKLSPQTAFTQGKLKLKGNVSMAMRFSTDILPKDAKL
ncbi:hypothetical protein FGO68_gene4596 [Halteria grandinella]|uniref:SCP2 domain-containing protein n=1 Tax=Halteria grandinella TaxID=5974 RepID=A0A8J8P545_HALGN|nr:hypothetical protein FGO68_gene4596 [Halteria grandinella]